MEKSSITEEILNFIKNSLKQDNPEFDTSGLNIDTDLSEYGIESIKVLTLLAEIEEEFNLSLELDNLEACDYKIYVKEDWYGIIWLGLQDTELRFSIRRATLMN